MTGGSDTPMMDGWLIWHWITFVIIAALLIYPVGRILSRLGCFSSRSILAQQARNDWRPR